MTVPLIATIVIAQIILPAKISKDSAAIARARERKHARAASLIAENVVGQSVGMV